jgi:hypothetical protein
MRHTALPIAMQLFCIGAAACQQDSVQPGFTDPYAVNPPTGQAGTGGAVAPGVGLTGTLMSSAAGTGMIAMPATGMTGMIAVPATGMTAMPGTAALGTAGATGTASAGAGMPTPTGGACDISGRWMSTIHAVTETLGQEQTTHFFIYYEIERQGADYKITKGLHCGDDAQSTGDLAVMVDFTAAWHAERMKMSYAGRGVSSTPSAKGCDVHFAKAYTVRGATLPYYLDPKNALPSAGQPASGSMPGWEDWDNDGQPGVTGLLSGPGATGRVFVAPRQWTELSGTVPNTMTSMRLALDWDQEQNVMAYDPSWNVTLGTPSSRHPNNSLHFGEFMRLADAQATGDDNAICDAVIKLAPMLTPAASAI